MKEKKEILNLPMRKQFALEILKGDKICEYRQASDHWCKILGEFNDPKNKRAMTGVKDSYKIAHFYPYNNKWFLDVEILGIFLTEIDEEFQNGFFGQEYQGEIGDLVFVIELGDVIGTNLSE